MSAINDYPTNCDYLRSRYGLLNNTSIYELIGKIVSELKDKSLKNVEEVECQISKKKVTKKSTKKAAKTVS